MEIVSGSATVLIRLSMIGTDLFYLKVQVLLHVIAALPLAIYLGLVLQLRPINILAHDSDPLIAAIIVEHQLLLLLGVPVYNLLLLLVCPIVHYHFSILLLPVDFLFLSR